jgi:tRNA (cmo5U34)-methyltransferase
MTIVDFSFATHADGFDDHIRQSIPGLDALRGMTVDLSRHFVQPNTTVIDIGCSTGAVLRAIRDAHQASRATASYVGVDIERRFDSHWRELAAPNLRFEVADARTFGGLQNMSLAISLFTLQFIPEADRLALLRRVHDGLIEGGALIIAEKVLAPTARAQNLFLGPHYDFKRRTFSEKEILEKERALRWPMHVWYEGELIEVLCEAGFEVQEINRFWQSYFFIGLIAEKRAIGRPRIVRECLSTAPS